MRLQINVKELTRQIWTICKTSPVEVIISFYTMIYSVVVYSNRYAVNDSPQYLLPLFFALSFVLGRISRNRIIRACYYISALFPLIFMWNNVSEWIGSTGYIVALMISFCLLFIYTRPADNNIFITRTLKFAGDIASSLMVTVIANFTLFAIYASATYIFSLDGDNQWQILPRIALVVFTFVWPVIFLLLNLDDKPTAINSRATPSLLVNILNYILTPALLIYTAILYTYFVVITLQWSLPKGGIAACVFGFMITAAAVKACQPLLDKKYVQWFFRYLSYLSLPALVMFWIGALRRINEYGLTESRFYLVVCGGIMTLYVILFMSDRLGRYLYILTASLLLLAFFTYIPRYTAGNIAKQSQLARIESITYELNLLDKSGKIKNERLPESSIANKEALKQLYDAFWHVEREQKKSDNYMSDHYGISATELLNDVYPQSVRDFVAPPYRHSDKNIISLLQYNTREESLDGFTTMYIVAEDKYDLIEKGILTIKTESESIIFSDSVNRIIEHQFKKLGLQKNMPELDSIIQARAKEFLVYDNDSLRINFLRINMELGDSIKVSSMQPSCILRR